MPQQIAARELAIACLATRNPREKCRLAAELPADGSAFSECPPVEIEPGRPAFPRLVDPRDLPARGLGDPRGHAAFVHAICHIEFTAINLALDAVLAFAGMPPAYYRDWLAVAREEALHFTLLEEHLATLGFRYGAFDAHAGLWDMAARTRGDLVARMALVPRVMEARGLDVTPGMIRRLAAIGDDAGAAILTRILEDEVGHVARGGHWFAFACEARGLEPAATFAALVREHVGHIRSKRLNHAARRAAGFSERELALLGAS